MKQISTFSQYHLGDNLVHLHFLRALAKAHPEIFFTHTANANHIAQLRPLVEDLPNLSLSGDFSQLPQGSINAWRGTDGHWYSHPDRLDFAKYHLRWFEVLAQRMGGLRSPFTQPADLLFDYPALQRKAPAEGSAKAGGDWKFLLVNSAPMSGQWSGYDPMEWARLAFRLERCGSVITTASTGNRHIPCTQDFGKDITGIGRLSQRAQVIIGCVTGPLWVTENIWNQDSVSMRIHLLDTERVEISRNTIHANSLSLVPEILRERGLL